MYCLKCGKQLPDTAAFCAYCGEKTSPSAARGAPSAQKHGGAPAKQGGKGASPAVKKAKPKSKVKTWIIIAAVAVVIVGVGGFFAYRYFFDNPLRDFSELVDRALYSEAYEVFNAEIDGDHSQTTRAADLVSEKARNAADGYANETMGYEEALAILTQLNEFEALANDEIQRLIDETNELRTSRVSFSAGQGYITDGQYPEAIAELRKVTERDASYATAQEQLVATIAAYKANVLAAAAAAEGNRAFTEAADILENALTIVQADADFTARLEQVRSAHIADIISEASALGNYGEALALLREGERLYPEDSAIKQHIASIQATEAAQTQVAQEQEIADAIQRIETLLAADNLPQAIAEAEAISRKYSANAVVAEWLTYVQNMDIEAVAAEASKLANERKYTDAHNVLGTLLSKYPDNALVKEKIAALEAEMYPALDLEDAVNIGDAFTVLSNVYDNYNNPYGKAVELNQYDWGNTTDRVCQVLLDGNYSRFKGTFFVPRSSTNYERAKSFRIELDERVIYEPHSLGKTSRPIYVDISVAGGNNFRIIVSSASNSPKICVGNAGFFN